jgi:4a-hydroxytetrahydrobiopterin dehydratase
MTKTFNESEAKAWLTESLPTWNVEENHLTRTYRTGGWQLTLLVANAIAYLAENGHHHPELILNYPSVKVRLQTHDAGGLTQKDFELARKIEETITWYPAPDDALSGKAKNRIE